MCAHDNKGAPPHGPQPPVVRLATHGDEVRPHSTTRSISEWGLPSPRIIEAASRAHSGDRHALCWAQPLTAHRLNNGANAVAHFEIKVFGSFICDRRHDVDAITCVDL